MTKSNNEWVPEIGKEYLLVSMGMCLMNEPVKITYTGKDVGCYERLRDGMEFTYASNQTVFKEIKTESEKRRELSIGELASDIGSMGLQAFDDPWMAATKLHEKGWLTSSPP